MPASYPVSDSGRKPHRIGSNYAKGAYKVAFFGLILGFAWVWLCPGGDPLESLRNFRTLAIDRGWSWIPEKLPSPIEYQRRCAIVGGLLFLLVVLKSPFFRTTTERFLFRLTGFIEGLFQRPFASIVAKVTDLLQRIGKRTDGHIESRKGWAWEILWIVYQPLLWLVFAAGAYIFIMRFIFGPVIIAFVWIALPVIVPLANFCFVSFETLRIAFSENGGGFGADFSAVWKSVSIFLPYFIKYWFGPWFLMVGWFKLNKWLLGLSETSFLRRIFFVGKGASSRWAGPRTFSKMSKTPGGNNLFLGTTDWHDVGPESGELIYNNDDAHMITIGLAGSGKSVSCIWPAIATYEGSLFIYDPVGEHARETFWRRNSGESWYRHAKGTKRCLNYEGFSMAPNTDNSLCFKLDPFNHERSIPGCSYNPLDEIDLKEAHATEMITSIAEGCVISSGQEKDPFWNDSAKKVIAGFIAYVLETQPRESRNLPFVHDILTEFDPKFGLLEDPARLEKILVRMRELTGAGNIAAIGANALGDPSGSQFRGIMGVVINSVAWMGSKEMRAHLSGESAFSFKSLRCGKAKSVYVVMQVELMETYGRWIRVLTNLGLMVMQWSGKERSALVVLDEFSKLGGQIPAIESGITTFRKQGIKLWMFIQNVGQFSDYKKPADFFENSTVQVVGVQGGSSETAEWVSGMLGKKAHELEYDSLDSREVMTSHQVAEMLTQMAPHQIIFPVKSPFPMRLGRLAHTKIKKIKGHPFLKGCFEGEG